MKKKGFTLIELLAVIIIIGILLSIAISGYQIYVNSSRSKSFNIAEKSLVTAVREAYADCATNNPGNDFCGAHRELTTKYTYELIYLKELISDNYMREVHNPYNTNQLCNTEKSYVYVGSKSDAGINGSDIVYKTCLVCGDRKSKDCLDDDLDYSTFDTTCTAYYDTNSGTEYNGAWTDQNIYLNFGASGNYRYGIDEFVYTVGGGSNQTALVKNSSNTVTLTLSSNVANKEYKVQARDGASGKGTIVSCGNIKIDKASIDSVNITGKTVSGNTVSNDGWVTEQVILTANVNPSTSDSGYLYQWYLNGNKYGEQTTSKTLTVQAKGTYKVEVTNRVGKIVKTSNDFSIKIDTKNPTCTLAASGTKYNNIYTSNVSISFASLADIEDNGIEGSGIVTKTIDTSSITTDVNSKLITGTVIDGVGKTGTCTITITKDTTTPSISAKNATNNITQTTNTSIATYFNTTYGVSGGNVVCKVGSNVVTSTNDLTLGVNEVTCMATGNNGKTSSATTTFVHQYTATGRCSSGTLVNNSSCYFASNASVCGTTCHYGCDSTWNSCKTGSPNQCVAGYTSECKTYSCTLYKSCTLSSTCRHTNSSACYKHAGYLCSTEFGGEYIHTVTTTGRQSGCGTETVTGSSCNNAQSKYCSEYVYSSCASTTNTCQGGYVDTNCSSCKTTSANSCNKTDSSYLSYSCPTTGKNGNTGQTISPTLNGSTCSF